MNKDKTTTLTTFHYANTLTKTQNLMVSKNIMILTGNCRRLEGSSRKNIMKTNHRKEIRNALSRDPLTKSYVFVGLCISSIFIYFQTRVSNNFIVVDQKIIEEGA